MQEAYDQIQMQEAFISSYNYKYHLIFILFLVKKYKDNNIFIISI